MRYVKVAGGIDFLVDKVRQPPAGGKGTTGVFVPAVRLVRFDGAEKFTWVPDVEVTVNAQGLIVRNGSTVVELPDLTDATSVFPPIATNRAAWELHLRDVYGPGGTERDYVGINALPLILTMAGTNGTGVNQLGHSILAAVRGQIVTQGEPGSGVVEARNENGPEQVVFVLKDGTETSPVDQLPGPQGQWATGAAEDVAAVRQMVKNPTVLREALVEEFARGVSVLAYGAKPTLNDNAQPIRDAIAALPAGGGTVHLPAGVFKISSGIDVPSNVTLRGSWSGVGFDPGQKTGTVLLWTGPPNAVMVQIFGRGFVGLDGIVVNGNSTAGVCGVLIDSANVPATRNISLRNVSIVLCGVNSAPNGVGLQIGTSGTSDFQNDAISLERFEINYCGTGIHALSGNALSICGFRDGTMYENNKHVFIEEGGPVHFDNVAWGGAPGPDPAFVHLTSASPFVFTNCQGEDATRTADFIRVTGSPSIAGPITLMGCIVNTSMEINAARRILSVGNQYTENVHLNGAGSIVTSIQDSFDPGIDFVVSGANVQVQRLTPRGSSPYMETTSNIEGVVHRFRAGGPGVNPSVELVNSSPGGGSWQMLFPGNDGLLPGGLVFRGGGTNPLMLLPGQVGFYGSHPVPKQTGVPVTAEGVHAALVALGLIG